VGGVEVTRIVTSNDPGLLQVLRGVVRYRAQQAGIAESDAEALAMAIDEAASNVIRHTYGNRHDARLALELWIYPDRMELVLEDSGPKVEPGEVRPRPLEDVRPGGLGTFFIKSFVDECAYEENFPAGNRLKLVKYFSRKVAPGDESPD